MLIHGMVIVGDTSCAFLGAVAVEAPNAERDKREGENLGKRVAALAVKLHGE